MPTLSFSLNHFQIKRFLLSSSPALFILVYVIALKYFTKIINYDSSFITPESNSYLVDNNIVRMVERKFHPVPMISTRITVNLKSLQ
jgi:hypothetical protein